MYLDLQDNNQLTTTHDLNVDHGLNLYTDMMVLFLCLLKFDAMLLILEQKRFPVMFTST